MTTLTLTRSERIWQVLNPLTMARNLWRYRDLIRQFTRREVESRYRGSFLGLFWSLVNPLVLLLIYTFVFGFIFKARWPQAQNNGLGAFAVIVFGGLTAFNIFSESLTRATTLIVSTPNYVKKVVFPLEILPVSTVGSALFHALINLVVLLVASLLINGYLPWTLPLLPLVALPLIFLSLGLAWFLASLGVYIRDISYTVGLVVQVLFFMTPVFYPIENIPEPFRTVISYNPLAPIIENIRNVLVWGTLPHWGSLALLLLLTGGIMVLGYGWFIKTKKGFADVI